MRILDVEKDDCPRGEGYYCLKCIYCVTATKTRVLCKYEDQRNNKSSGPGVDSESG